MAATKAIKYVYSFGGGKAEEAAQGAGLLDGDDGAEVAPVVEASAEDE